QTTATETPQTAATEPPSQPCPYCGTWYYTTPYADGTSDYSIHVAAEEQAAQASQDALNGIYTTDYQTTADGSLYAQCPYCFQWFSDMADQSGYSPYAQHVAAESAYAAQIANEEYVQCPYCGNWVTQSEYQDHMNVGW
ncbi:MAG: hypothetical protein Q4C50_12555, partial [Eubacteriales bacterium]|nr:hypothetical protein [Eubacteriales bacterium]